LPLPVIPSGCEGSGFEAIWSIPEGEGSRLFVILRSVFRDEGSRVGLFQIQKQVPRRSAPSGRQGQVVIPSGWRDLVLRQAGTKSRSLVAPLRRDDKARLSSRADARDLVLRQAGTKSRSLVAPLRRDDIQRQQQTREFFPRTQSRNRHPEQASRTRHPEHGIPNTVDKNSSCA